MAAGESAAAAPGPIGQAAPRARTGGGPEGAGARGAPDQAGRSEAGGSVEERIAARTEAVHVLTGAVCNNNCIFCMEEDRDARYVTNSATTDESVRWILERNPNAEEFCFTSGEPTTNPRLPHWVKWARQRGIPRVSVMTNGRALGYERYAKGLVAAGMNRFYVSIHGHEQRLHEGLTRTPDSFAQTVAGLDMIASLKRYGVDLHTSTVITKRNLPHMAEIYRFLRAHGVDQVVFNVMQANGRANTFFDQIFPTYTEIAATAKSFLDDAGRLESPVMAFLVDIPLCTTTALPDFNRGYVEKYVHYEPEASAGRLISADRLADRRPDAAQDMVAVKRADLDDAQRHKRAECAGCRYHGSCEGVWGNYLRRYGWDEFVPVPA